MRSGRKDLLFYESDLSATLDNHFSRLGAAITEIDAVEFLQTDDEQIIERIFEQFVTTPIQIEKDGITMEQTETEVDVSRDPMRNVFGDQGPILVKGLAVAVAIPYQGDDLLWQLRPNRWQSVFPRGEIRKDTADGRGILIMRYQQPADEDPAKMKTQFDRDLESIEFYLEAQRAQIENENAKLRDKIQTEIKKRRNVQMQQDSVVDVFGLPEKKAQTAVPSSSESKTESKLRNETEEWDLFISHASEDKADFVRPLVEALGEHGISVWYDEFTLKVGDSLRRSIDKGLANSRYGAVIISPNFLSKEWPQRELDGLVAREIAGRKVILPVWHGVDYDTVTAYSPTLADKLATNSEKGIAQVVKELIDAIR